MALITSGCVRQGGRQRGGLGRHWDHIRGPAVASGPAAAAGQCGSQGGTSSRALPSSPPPTHAHTHQSPWRLPFRFHRALSLRIRAGPRQQQTAPRRLPAALQVGGLSPGCRCVARPSHSRTADRLTFCRSLSPRRCWTPLMCRAHIPTRRAHENAHSNIGLLHLKTLAAVLQVSLNQRGGRRPDGVRRRVAAAGEPADHTGLRASRQVRGARENGGGDQEEERRSGWGGSRRGMQRGQAGGSNSSPTQRHCRWIRKEVPPHKTTAPPPRGRFEARVQEDTEPAKKIKYGGQIGAACCAKPIRDHGGHYV